MGTVERQTAGDGAGVCDAVGVAGTGVAEGGGLLVAVAGPPEPEQPPPTPPPPSAQDVTPEANSVAVQAAPVDTKVDLSASGFSLSPSDGDYLPIVKVQPIYPRRALERGIEGYVIVQFTVTKQGTTKDIKVVESHPPGVFDRAAVQAAAKFKYKPRVVDGQPIQVPGVKNKITFKIEK